MRVILLLVFLALAACSPYKMDIRQGNLVTQDMRLKLKVGMNRSQVQQLLGTPLVTDPFHPERWDYVYRLEQDGQFVEQQRLTLYFTGESLTRIDDSHMPPLVAEPAAPAGAEERQQP